MDYRKGEKLFSAASYVCIALVLVSSVLRIRWLSAAGLGVLAVGLVLMLAFCKCPHCGSHMRLRKRKTGDCPECGKHLADRFFERGREEHGLQSQ